METVSIKFETMFDDINRLKAEKCRLEERLKTVRLERSRKEATSAAMSQKRATVANLLAKQGENLKLIQHRVRQQQAQITDLRGDVAQKGDTIKQLRVEVDELKKKQKDDSDKFDAEMESIYVEVKKTWGFYTPSNLDAVFSNTSEAQRCISAEVQETDNAFAKLQVEDDEAERGFLVNAVTQQLIQFVLSEDDKAMIFELEALNQQCDQLHSQIEELA